MGNEDLGSAVKEQVVARFPLPEKISFAHGMMQPKGRFFSNRNQVRSFLDKWRLHIRHHWLLLVGMGLFFQCSSSIKEDQISAIPISQTDHFRYVPGEKLTYEVDAGWVRVGSLEVRVAQDTVLAPGKSLAYVEAEAHTRKGIAWVSKNDHFWQAWIDTANGLSVKTYRKVRENNYRGEFDYRFFPDSNQISMQKLHKPDRPIRKYSCRPDQMQDLVNMIWRFRFDDWHEKKAGDTVRYYCFFDGEWLAFSVRYNGFKDLGGGKGRIKTFAFQILGIHSRMLVGENPVEVFIEAKPQRRPVLVKVASYLGDLKVKLVR